MTWSLGETQSLAQKACVGAGYRWGQAEDAGRAVRFLCSYGIDGTEHLAVLLEKVGDGPVDGSACPISLGTRIADGDLSIGAEPVALDRIAAPHLLIPFVAWAAAKHGQWLNLTLPDVTVTVAPSGRIRMAERTGSGIDVRVMTPATDDLPAPHMTRATIAPRPRKILNQFAGRTYAPATEESRAKGAG